MASPQVEVTIPEGSGPGSTFHVQASGQMIAVQVPPGMKGGMVIRVEVPTMAAAQEDDVEYGNFSSNAPLFGRWRDGIFSCFSHMGSCW